MRAIALSLCLTGCVGQHGFVRAAAKEDGGWHSRALVDVPIAQHWHGELLLDAERDGDVPDVGWLVEPSIHYDFMDGFSVYGYMKRDDYGVQSDAGGLGLQWSF